MQLSREEERVRTHYFTSVSQSITAPGVGRGGILEKLVISGRSATVPVGRGFAPPGWGRFIVVILDTSSNKVIKIH